MTNWIGSQNKVYELVFVFKVGLIVSFLSSKPFVLRKTIGSSQKIQLSELDLVHILLSGTVL